MNIPTLQNSNARRSQQFSHSLAQMRRGSRSVDEELQLACNGEPLVHQGVKPSSEPDIRRVAMAQAKAKALTGRQSTGKVDRRLRLPT